MLFLAVFLLVYGGMHYYIYIKVAPLLPLARVYVAWVFAILVVSPILIRLLINVDWVGAAHAVAAIGYSWMGFALLLFSFLLVTDVIRGALWLIAKVGNFGMPLLTILSSSHVTVMIMVLAMAVCVYGAYSASQINFTRIQFPTPKFAPDQVTFRIVQITDLHLGLLSSAARIQHIVAQINALHPDLIVSTGDLVDMQANHISKFAATMRELRATYGCYAVTGNHEAYAGIDDALAFTRDAGFTVLSSESRQIDNRVNIVGVDDPAVIHMVGQAPLPEATVLQQFNNGYVTILLKHQPVINQAAEPYFDLQLSGHVHGGQIFPFGLFTWLTYQVHMGMTQVSPATWLYVSYGSGTWGPPIRFLASPEITVIDIVPER